MTGNSPSEKRLPSCDRYHKNIPSVIKIYKTYHTVSRAPTTRRHCVICDKFRRYKPREPKSTPKGNAYSLYGVIPLTWRPPELGSDSGTSSVFRDARDWPYTSWDTVEIRSGVAVDRET